MSEEEHKYLYCPYCKKHRPHTKWGQEYHCDICDEANEDYGSILL